MADDAKPKLEYQPIGKSGKVQITARFPDGSTFTDKVDVADATGRQRFLRGLLKDREGLDGKTIEAELEKIAAEIVAKPEEESEGGRRSQADQLVELTENVKLFHSPGDDGDGYAIVPDGDHRETMPIKSRQFRNWLSSQFYQTSDGKVPGSQALQDAVNTLTGKALHDGPEHPVHVRIAQDDEAIYLDLCNDRWECVRIGPHGWEVIRDPSVRFVRKRGMLELPTPQSGGSLDDLRPLVNVPGEDDWRLLLAWLIAAMRPDRPFPILIVNGEQGSAKSTLCRLLRRIIDPNKAALRRPPRSDRDLMIAAGNGWIVGYDNLSGLKPELSDSLCTLATGGGFGTRELYSDDDEKLFEATRPIMINGIEDLASRSDLLDRAIILRLPPIPEENRMEENEINARFKEALPGILGALCDVVSAAMKKHPSVNLPRKPRMADFATWAVAAEDALGWPEGAFMAAYLNNRNTSDDSAIEASPIGPVVLKLMEATQCWTGTVGELLSEIFERADELTRRRRDWPKTPQGFSGRLRRLSPNLRRVGIIVTFGDHSNLGRLVTLEYTRNPSSPSSESSSDDVGDESDDSLQSCSKQEEAEWTG